MRKTPWRSKLYNYYDQHPEISPSEAARAVGCGRNTASSAKFCWKKLRGYATGTKLHPVIGLVKIGVEVKKEEPPKIPEAEIQVTALADELLKKVFEAIKSYNNILGERNFFKEQASISEAKAKKVEEEKVRVVKAYNELVKRVNRGELPTLDEIIHALRRELKPGEKI